VNILQVPYLRGLEITELTEEDMPLLRTNNPHWSINFYLG